MLTPPPAFSYPLAVTHPKAWLLTPQINLACFWLLAKWNHMVYILLSGFLHSALCLLDGFSCRSFIPRVFWFSGVWMYHQGFVHSTLDGHLSCFHFDAIIISAALNILAHVFWWIYEHISVGYVLTVEILGHEVCIWPGLVDPTMFPK